MQSANNWQNRDGMKIKIFFKDRNHPCSFEWLWKYTLLKWKIDKHVKVCLERSTWSFRILAGMLHGPGLLFWLILLINFSISDSWIWLMKNYFWTLFLKYVLKGLFPFRIRPKIWTNNKRIIEYLSDAIFIFNNFSIYNKQTWSCFIFRFKCYNWFDSVSDFFSIFRMLLKIILIIFFFRFFDFEVLSIFIFVILYQLKGGIVFTVVTFI